MTCIVWIAFKWLGRGGVIKLYSQCSNKLPSHEGRLNSIRDWIDSWNSNLRAGRRKGRKCHQMKKGCRFEATVNWQINNMSHNVNFKMRVESLDLPAYNCIFEGLSTKHTFWHWLQKRARGNKTRILNFSSGMTCIFFALMKSPHYDLGRREIVLEYFFGVAAWVRVFVTQRNDERSFSWLSDTFLICLLWFAIWNEAFITLLCINS